MPRPELGRNTIEGATYIGLRVGRGAHPILTGNRICGNAADLVLDDGAEHALEENDICADPPRT